MNAQLITSPPVNNLALQPGPGWSVLELFVAESSSTGVIIALVGFFLTSVSLALWFLGSSVFWWHAESRYWTPPQEVVQIQHASSTPRSSPVNLIIYGSISRLHCWGH